MDISLLLSLVEEHLGCHDLNQPYYHKTIILLLHTENDNDGCNSIGEEEFPTRGLVLNRPSELVLTEEDLLWMLEEEVNDDENEDDGEEVAAPTDYRASWQMSFGGDIAGLFSNDKTQITFLHSISTPLGKRVSKEVLPDQLYATDYNGVRTLLIMGGRSL